MNGGGLHVWLNIVLVKFMFLLILVDFHTICILVDVMFGHCSCKLSFCWF
jgi:hypothetical protein